jgi:hypothetical protein
MVKPLYFISLVLLLQGNALAANYAQVPASQRPSVSEIIARADDATLEPVIYPRFTNYTTKAGISDTVRDNCYKEVDAISEKPILSTGLPDYTELSGLTTTLEVQEPYRKTAKILITWTVRIEASLPDWHLDALRKNLGDDFCAGWCGTKDGVYLPGKVKTALYVINEKKGMEVAMEIPGARELIVDPTLVGTYLLRASDFSNSEFPQGPFTIAIKWKNETAKKILCLKGHRSLTINYLPITKQ